MWEGRLSGPGGRGDGNRKYHHQRGGGCRASGKERTGDGRPGAGLDDARLQRKICLIEEALERYGLRTDASSGGFDDALKALSAVGGLDLAGLAGVYIGGALYGLPVVLDGVISMTAALAAERIAPGTAAYLLPSHMSREPAAAELSRALGLFPVICADMALGEGTGAVMLLALLDMALRVYQDRVTFFGYENSTV